MVWMSCAVIIWYVIENVTLEKVSYSVSNCEIGSKKFFSVSTDLLFRLACVGLSVSGERSRLTYTS